MQKIARDIKLTLKSTAVKSEMQQSYIRRPENELAETVVFLYKRNPQTATQRSFTVRKKQVHFRLARRRRLFQIKALNVTDHTNVCWFQSYLLKYAA